MQLREAVFTARARLKQAELEAEQWKEELRRLQAHSQEQEQQIHVLRQERLASQEKTNRLVCLLEVCVYSLNQRVTDIKMCLCLHICSLTVMHCNVSSGSSMRCLYCSSSCVRAESSATPCRVNYKCMIECVPAQNLTKVCLFMVHTLCLIYTSF